MVTPPTEETKAERFERVMTARLEKVVKQIRNLGNCSGANYESTPEQIENITGYLHNEISKVAKRYEATEEPEGSTIADEIGSVMSGDVESDQ